MKHQKAIQLAVFAALCMVETVALAAAPFLGGGYQLKSDLIGILTPIYGIGLLAVGGLCMFGKIHWAWLGAMVIGGVFIFANDQMVLWLKSLFM